MREKYFTDKAFEKSINVRMSKARKKWIGFVKDLGDGYTATITEYRRNNDIDVVLSNGENCIEIKGTSVHNFNNNMYTKYFNKKYMKPRNKHLGESRKMNCGYTATIIKSDNILDISVQFDDDEQTIVEHKEYSSFLTGSIHCPSSKEKPQDRVGKFIKDKYASKLLDYEFHIDKYDIDAKVIEYNDCNNVIVRFSDGIEKKCTARAVRKNFVRRDDLEGIIVKNKNKEKWIGKIFELNEGYIAKVVDYEDSENVTVEINGERYISQIRSLNKKSVPKELKYNTISEPGRIYVSVSGMPFKVINIIDGGCEIILMTGKKIKYTHTKAINSRSAGGRICINQNIAGFTIESRQNFNDKYYYMCHCNDCDKKGLFTPVEMINHAIEKHNFKAAFYYQEDLDGRN